MYARVPFGGSTKSCMTLRTLNYGNYGIFLIMGHAGFCPSAVAIDIEEAEGSFSVVVTYCDKWVVVKIRVPFSVP